jgi:hypothetical protein
LPRVSFSRIATMSRWDCGVDKSVFYPKS